MGPIDATNFSIVESSSLKSLLEAIQDSKINADAVAGDKDSRAKLLTASKKLTAALEAPDDALNYAQFYVCPLSLTRGVSNYSN